MLEILLLVGSLLAALWTVQDVVGRRSSQAYYICLLVIVTSTSFANYNGGLYTTDVSYLAHALAFRDAPASRAPLLPRCAATRCA